MPRPISYFQQRYNLSTAALISFSSCATRKELRAWCIQWLGEPAWRGYLNAEHQAAKRQRDRNKIRRVCIDAEAHNALKALAQRNGSSINQALNNLIQGQNP